jgi:hypothetical protein
MRKLAVSALIVLLAGPVLGGVVYEIEFTDHGQSPPKEENIEVAAEGRNLKMGIGMGGSDGEGTMIFRGGEQPEMIVIDHEKKSYFVMDREQIEEVAGQVNQAMAQMEEALKNVPEEQRAMVEQMMKKRMPKQQAPAGPSSELRKTGERGEKNGYPCVKYEVLRKGEIIGEMWVTEWKNVESSGEVQAVFGEMAEFFRSMLDSFSSMAGAGGVADEMDSSFFGHMKDLGGFPVLTRNFQDDGSLEGESTLRSAKRQTIDPDAFEPPSGYKRQEMFKGR